MNAPRILSAMLGALILVLVISGCSTINEHYYLHDQAARSGPSLDLPNYYRVSVKGHAKGSSRYLAGWFNENAVDVYFNEISPPDKHRFIEQDQSSSNKVVSVDGDNADKKLVLLLSSNTDLIAGQIGALAENEMLVDAFMRLSNKQVLVEGYESTQKVSLLNARISSIQTAGNNTISSLPDSATVDQIRTATLQYLNLVATHAGATANFKSVEDATDWWLRNKNSIVNQ